MIDIHSHVIFDVDDGPDGLEESLDLIAMSYTQGVRTIVATSHRRKGLFDTAEEVIYANFLALKEAAERRFDGLSLVYGGELYYVSELPSKLEQETVPRMGATRFALIEFSRVTRWSQMQEAVSRILMVGVTPIIAHIERYDALEGKAERVQSLIDMGCYTQINSSHVLKPKLFGDPYKLFKKRAAYFLKENLVHCVASDMHNTGNRPPYMKQAYDLIAKDYGKSRARQLFYSNPRTLLENNYI